MFGKERKEKEIRKEILSILEKRGEEGITVPEIDIPHVDEDEIEDAFFELELDNEVQLIGFKDFVREDGGLFSIGVYKMKK